MGKWYLHACLFILDQILIKVAGNQDRHKSSDKFDFGPLVSMAHLCFLKWDLTFAHWTQVSDRCPLGYLLEEGSPEKMSYASAMVVVLTDKLTL